MTPNSSKPIGEMLVCDEDMRPKRRVRRIIAAGLSLALLAGAIILVVQQRAIIADAMGNVADLPASRTLTLIAVMLVSVVGNIGLTGLMFERLMSRYGQVGRFEMQAVIASATMINYLPLRPGIVGRIAYHRTVNSIPVSASIVTVVQAAVISGIIALVLGGASLMCRRIDLNPWLIVGAPLILMAVASIAAPSRAYPLIHAAAFRLADVLVTAVRYHAAFALIGSPIDWTGALAFACISVLATMVPLVSNGLGLREWAIGLLSPAIVAYQLELGVTADLLNRAAELLVVACTGMPATLWLARRVRAGGRQNLPAA